MLVFVATMLMNEIDINKPYFMDKIGYLHLKACVHVSTVWSTDYCHSSLKCLTLWIRLTSIVLYYYNY